jgi:hypothetical protein
MPGTGRLEARGCSSDGRALQSHCRGQGFDSPQLHQPAASEAFSRQTMNCSRGIAEGSYAVTGLKVDGFITDAVVRLPYSLTGC